MSSITEQNTNKSLIDRNKLKLLMEKVEDLPWRQRKILYSLINPCTQSFKEIEKFMIDVHDEGKIKKIILEHGDGEVIPFNASVYLHYSGFVEENQSPFDSSLLRSQSCKHYQMGGGYLFPGFEIALSTMKENEMSQFLIHPDYAFGKLGCPPRIPGNCPVMMVIHVIGFIDCGYVTLQKRNLHAELITFPEKIKVAKSHNDLAIDYYKHGRIKMAFHHFREAQYVFDEEIEIAVENQERLTFLQKSFVNQLMCLSHPKYLKPKKLIEVAECAVKKVPSIVNDSAKFHYCVGVAQTYLQDYEAASVSFKKAQTLSPFLPKLSNAVKHLHERTDKALKDEKTMWRHAFSKLGYNPIPNSDEPESNNIKNLRQYVNEILTRCCNKNIINSLNLGYGYTKSERLVLKEVATNLGLEYQESEDNYRLNVKIINKLK